AERWTTTRTLVALILSYPLYCSLLADRLSSRDTATTQPYTLSLHDALPIFAPDYVLVEDSVHDTLVDKIKATLTEFYGDDPQQRDRKSTRLNSSHVKISYAVFCLKKKKTDGRRAVDKQKEDRKDAQSCIILY